MDLELQGKVAIVTGGSKGIGKAVALELAREGASETGRRAIAISVDTTNSDEVQNMVDETVAELGKVDILINSAAMVGGQVRGTISEATEKDMLEDLDTKVVGYFRAMKAVVPHMQAQKWGRIISIGGVSARQSTIYGLRNAAIVHMTKTFSDQLGADGITLNVVHPGLTMTEGISRTLDQRAQNQGVSREELEQQMGANVAINRIVDAQELAYLCAFRCSPKAECVTGEVIAAGGGAKGGVHQ